MVGATVPTKVRAAFRTTVFLFEVFPNLPSRWLGLVTSAPKVESFRYQSSSGPVSSALYVPASAPPHPAVVVCLGVVPLAVDHPQVARLGRALAKSGFAALLYWSPAMRDRRLAAEDVGDIASAYEALMQRPDIDPGRSGLLGTCVGGSFALLAAATACISQRIAFVCAYAPYSSMWTLAKDIASSTVSTHSGRVPWAVDPLSRLVFTRSLTQHLTPDEREMIRRHFGLPIRYPRLESGSTEVQTVVDLLSNPSPDTADALLNQLPAEVQDQLSLLSPIRHVSEIHTPLIVLLHDRDDHVIPVGESRLLHHALKARCSVRYTEFNVFQHMAPGKRKVNVFAMTREMTRFWHAIYPLFVITSGTHAAMATSVDESLSTPRPMLP